MRRGNNPFARFRQKENESAKEHLERQPSAGTPGPLNAYQRQFFRLELETRLEPTALLALEVAQRSVLRAHEQILSPVPVEVHLCARRERKQRY